MQLTAGSFFFFLCCAQTKKTKKNLSFARKTLEMSAYDLTKANIVGVEESKPISMTLNNNRFILKESTGQWVLESSDLDIATLEIENLVDEKETLVKSLNTSITQIDALQQEVIEINEMKSVILEMVMHCFTIHSARSLHLS